MKDIKPLRQGIIDSTVKKDVLILERLKSDANSHRSLISRDLQGLYLEEAKAIGNLYLQINKLKEEASARLRKFNDLQYKGCKAIDNSNWEACVKVAVPELKILSVTSTDYNLLSFNASLLHLIKDVGELPEIKAPKYSRIWDFLAGDEKVHLSQDAINIVNNNTPSVKAVQALCCRIQKQLAISLEGYQIGIQVVRVGTKTLTVEITIRPVE